MANKRSILTGIIFILIAIWFYSALSTFKIEDGSDPERIIIKEGIIRLETDVAAKLADDNGFDLKGAYRSGHRPSDVIDYLINKPHTYSVTFYDGQYYEGRSTIRYSILLYICIFILIAGILIIISGNKKER